MSVVRVIGGDISEGDWQLTNILNNYQLNLNSQNINLNNNVANVDVLDDEKVKKLAGTAGWAFIAGIAGGLLTGGLGALAGLIGGALAGGNQRKLCLAVEFKDGRKFLCLTDTKTYRELVSLTYKKEAISLEGDMSSLTSKEFQVFISKKCHLPGGIQKEIFSPEQLSKCLVNFLINGEYLIDATGVRYKGENSFLVLSNKRIICFISEKKLHLDLSSINQVIASKNGIIFFSQEFNLRLYFADQQLGRIFTNSISKTSLIVENIDTIPTDEHEKTLEKQGLVILLIAIVVVIAFIVKSCS
ncbi:hypothetical protein H6G33_38200 [Calothrix sp. FACHB-1219]|uniref:hypothetical protein n=1 Tax=unclassified Calothrix TaxID=2619626 RepID=UPI0016845F36|nr:MULTISPECIES: hypothetical protein [unclassified Calothrix]MBD2208214.1 hypothetical protein [Calothrix sp. FACHB-168]MBD2222752.1 hypothetical protein [Calothrix sp. FACHB-1219]